MLTIAACLGAAACGSDRGQAGGAAGSPWTLDPEPIFSVGGYDERPEYNLHDVAAAMRLADGRVVVANAGSHQLRYFDPDGTYLRDAGGEGDGPGELRYIFQMVRGHADTLIVQSRNPGLTWYDGNGDYVRSERMRHDLRPATNPCYHGEANAWKIRPDGAPLILLQEDYFGAGCPPTPDGIHRKLGLLGTPDEDRLAFDTLLVSLATERVGPQYRVFGRELLLALGADRIFAMDTGSETIAAVSYPGDTLTTWPTPFESSRVPASVKDESLIEVPQPDGGVRFFPGYSDYPDFFPAVGRLLLDSEEMLWVMQYPLANEPFNSWRLADWYGQMVPAGGAHWAVLDRAGVELARLTTPPGLYVMEIGADYVLGVSRDDFDVETVVIYSLDRG